MASTSDIRNGMCIEYNNGLYFIVEFLHVKPGKGPAFVRTKLKNVKTGRVIDNTFNSGVKINEVRIERRPYQFLYRDDMGFVFMNQESYEQINIDENLINGVRFMKEGEVVEVVTHAETDTILYADMPTTVVLQVTYTEPGIRGDTATNTLKPATLETNTEIRVPLFLEIGDHVKVDTRDGSYIERAKV